MPEPTTRVSDMTWEQLAAWYYGHPREFFWQERLVALRDTILAEQREEWTRRFADVETAMHGYRKSWEQERELRKDAESRLADAERRGAYEAVLQCREAYDRWNESGSTNDASLAHDLTALTNKYRPAPARREVVVQGVTFWYEGNTWVEGPRPHYAMQVNTHFSRLADLFRSLADRGITPTASEYAALLALADGRDG